MVSITLSVPEDLKQDMEGFPEINWSEVARTAIRNKIVMLERFKAFTKESSLTEEDALKLGAEVSNRVMKKHR